ncbi:hypothetical protein JW968_02905 [Candidatus Woesearchaeota archaeon]|nr:hypothetical protein [Candidatus Woesearchaeota archaeon]
MIKLCEQYQDMDFSKLTDRELILFFDDFMKAYGELHFAGQPAGVMEYEHQYLSNHLIKKLKEKIEELDLARNEADLFSMMTTPTRPSYQQSEDLNLLKISEKIRQNEGMLQIFKSKQPNIISKVRRLYPALHKDIEKHHKEFCWLSYMWQGPCRKLDYYYELLIGLANDDCAERAKESNDHMKELEAEQRNILSMFDYKTRRLMEGAKDIVYLKGLRKDVLFLANHSMEKMQKEIMKRIGIVKPDFRLLLHDEIRSALMGADPKPLIKRRRKMHAIDYTEKGTEIFEGEDSASFIESLKIKTEIKEVHELKGMTAYPGEAIGIVKIINIPEDMDKMNEGDILVSQATQPDLIPAMKKAAAFVTDMGGITCHAAIVGREMKKPCVIGTKIATKVFKDGGRVFVDANNGVVRKV